MPGPERDERGREDFEARILELVMRQLTAIYWMVDRELRVVSTGGPVEPLLGYPPDRWIGSTIQNVYDVEGGPADSVGFHRRALAGETVTYQDHYRNKRLTVTVGPYYAGDQIVGAIGTAIDITAFHALENRMVDAQRAESLGVLAGGLAHDFNNLLVAIIGNADLGLRETSAGAPGHAALENIRDAGLRAAELTDQLLAYAGKAGVSKARVMPRAIVEELVKISAPTLPNSVTVSIDIPPSLALRGEAAQVRQVILNLLANARDALTAAGGGTIAVTGTLVKHSGSPEADDVLTPIAGDYVELAFTDNGPGMDRETRRRIFEPFFTTKATGHGLGLAAVLGIVRAHGGGLRLVSEPGTGARFAVLWPATTTPEQIEVPAVDPRTVLVIDDEDLVRDVVARMIEDLGYAAVTAADGPAALDIVDRRTIDAVLVDLTMPVMSGADVIAALRLRRPQLPVVLCSGYDRDRRGPVQADAYLPKPFRIDVLEQTLAKLLRPPP